MCRHLVLFQPLLQASHQRSSNISHDRKTLNADVFHAEKRSSKTRRWTETYAQLSLRFSDILRANLKGQKKKDSPQTPFWTTISPHDAFSAPLARSDLVTLVQVPKGGRMCYMWGFSLDCFRSSLGGKP